MLWRSSAYYISIPPLNVEVTSAISLAQAQCFRGCPLDLERTTNFLHQGRTTYSEPDPPSSYQLAFGTFTPKPVSNCRWEAWGVLGAVLVKLQMRIHERMNVFVTLDARWCRTQLTLRNSVSCVPYYSRRRKGSMRLRKEMNDITAYQGSHGAVFCWSPTFVILTDAVTQLTTLLELSNAPL